jgi:nucleoside-diphosphate-sugar epimerase
MNKILIAGGAGFIGSHLTRHFLGLNNEVWAIDNLVTGSRTNIEDLEDNPNFHFIESDIAEYDYSSLPRFDIVYDLASPASPILFDTIPLEILKTNSLGLMKLMEFVKKSKSKTVVFASTSEVYGDPQVSPQSEDYFGNVNSYGPRSCYDEGKRFAEAAIYSYVNKHGLDVRIARIFNTYGPNMNKADGRVISNFINQALENKSLTVYGDGTQTRSCCFVSDMVSGLYLLGTKPDIKGRVINLGNPDERKIIDIANLIKKLVKTESEISFLPIGQDDPKRRRPDITRAIELLGWAPKIDLESGLEKTISYFKSL